MQLAYKYKDRTRDILDYTKSHPRSSLAEIGRQFSVSREWVRKVLRREGIDQRARYTLWDWVLCEYCRKYFLAPKSEISRGRKFCSRPCAYSFRRITHRVARRCEVCKKTFLVPRYYLKLGKGKLCSRKCRTLYVQELRRRSLLKVHHTA